MDQHVNKTHARANNNSELIKCVTHQYMNKRQVIHLLVNKGNKSDTTTGSLVNIGTTQTINSMSITNFEDINKKLGLSSTTQTTTNTSSANSLTTIVSDKDSGHMTHSTMYLIFLGIFILVLLVCSCIALLTKRRKRNKNTDDFEVNDSRRPLIRSGRYLDSSSRSCK